MSNTQKRILINTIAFSPDGVSTAYLYNDIAKGLKQNGFDVVVLTTTPHYNLVPEELAKQPLKKHLLGLYSTSNYENIKVYHIPAKKYKRTLYRLIPFIYWHFMSVFIALFLGRVHVVLAPSPPLTIGLISIIIANIKGAKAVYNVQEIYPDFLINHGNIKSQTIINLLKRLERLVYNRSTLVTTIDDLFYTKIRGRFNDPSKLKVIPNFVDTSLYRPFPAKNEWSLKQQSDADLRLVYAGNIGHAQDWEPVLYAAEKLKDKKIEFWIIGEGVKKDTLINAMRERKLDHVKILPYQSREQMPLINAFGDVHFIAMNPELEQEGFPSKVYTIMACAKPMIILTGKNTPLYNFLKDQDCAILIDENKNNAFVEAIEQLNNNPELREKMGNSGLDTIRKKYSKEVVISQYVEALKTIV